MLFTKVKKIKQKNIEIFTNLLGLILNNKTTDCNVLRSRGWKSRTPKFGASSQEKKIKI